MSGLGVSLSVIRIRLWHVIAMIRTVLAYEPPHGAASSAGSGTHWFAIGLLVGFAVAAFTPGIVKGLVLLFDVVALGWSTGILHYSDTGNGRWVLIAVAAAIVGIGIGTIRGLRMLGEHEYLTRHSGMGGRGWWPFKGFFNL
jgi:hypothetical protein